MKKIKLILRIVLSIVFVLILSSTMFYCLVAGASEGRDEAVKYILLAAGFSVLICGMLCAMWNYIEYLHRKIEKLEENKIDKKKE